MTNPDTESEGMEERFDEIFAVVDEKLGVAKYGSMTHYPAYKFKAFIREVEAAAEKRMVERVIAYLEPQAPHICQDLRDKFLAPTKGEE